MTPLHVRRYLTPLREGGSLPAIVEGDDDGTWVLKFRGAGQGAKALVAEWLGGELARALGLDVPALRFAHLDPELARTEPDPEIQDLLRASGGLNLAVDYLPGSITCDPAVDVPDVGWASRVAWLDAFIANVDRSARNPNLLMWHRRPWLIDHGASFVFHHGWDDDDDADARHAASPFAPIAGHVLLPWARDLEAADAHARAVLGDGVAFDRIVDALPDAWLSGGRDAASQRARYRRHLGARLTHRDAFVDTLRRAVEEATRGR